MGASRDLTAGARSGTTTLERPAVRRTRPAQPRTPGVDQPVQAPRRYAPHALHPRNTQGSGRLGSRQVVSVRGRRVGEVNEVKRKFSAVTAIAIPLLILGVIIAMYLSGLSTTQSFAVQELQARERQLNNEVETLNRDLENLQSSAGVAEQAAQAGMVVSHVPGILAVDAEGTVHEERAFNPEATQKMTDVTAAEGERAREDRATSDRAATAQVGRNLTELPGGNVLGHENGDTAAPANSGAPVENLAPYAPRIPSAQ
ncbi:hypothetical protein [Corynebacterium qintianiae]|uniref:hypothetical protein n=1 Tax=Corynebacterium qintianiae TaxID=2709392 RepID=UPI0013EA598A|nr:hypothetical protein [Corynebacterium qintianiae]